MVDLCNTLYARGHDVFAVLRPHSPLIGALNIPPANIKTLPLRNALDAQSAHGLNRFVKDNQVDVVHAHMARDYSLAAYAARVKPRPKFFVTRHVLFELNGIHRRTLAKANRVIAVSDAVAKQLRGQRIVPDEMIAIVANGIDVERFTRDAETFDRAQLLSSKSIPKDCLLVGSIGELRKLKRHDDLIKAAALIVRQIEKVHLVIAGVDTTPGGEVQKELESLAQSLGLSEQVHFLGWLNDAEHWLRAMDVFVSASETESFGLSIAEAMACGTAVVATRTEGAQEVVEDQVSGLLVPIGEVEQIAESVVMLLKDETLRKRIGERAALEARVRFSLERMVDEIEKIYEED